MPQTLPLPPSLVPVPEVSGCCSTNRSSTGPSAGMTNPTAGGQYTDFSASKFYNFKPYFQQFYRQFQRVCPTCGRCPTCGYPSTQPTYFGPVMATIN